MIFLLILKTFGVFHRYDIFLNVASNYQWIYNAQKVASYITDDVAT